MKQVLRGQNDTNILMMTIFPKQIAHFIGIHFVSQIVENY